MVKQITSEQIKIIRETMVDKIAKDICDVQPMPNNLLKELRAQSLTSEQLVEQGYKPVSKISLLWVKDE